MTFQEANKGSKKLVCRNNLNRAELVKRLLKYFNEQETEEIVSFAELAVSWTDGSIAIICTDKNDKKFTAIASGIYIGLIEP